LTSHSFLEACETFGKQVEEALPVRGTGLHHPKGMFGAGACKAFACRSGMIPP
jgi:hypothetical protein